MSELERCREALRAMAFEISRAEDDERHRIAHGLHDDVGQLLALAKLRLRRLGRVQTTGGELERIIVLLDEAIAAIRSMTFDLVAPPSVDLDIAAALADLVDSIEERHDVRCTFVSESRPMPLERDVARALYRVVRELLANVVSHAEANRACVSLTTEHDQLQVLVADDGIGFAASREIPPERSGVGLLIVTERMAQVGGTVRIDSAPGCGARIMIQVPLDTAEVRP